MKSEFQELQTEIKELERTSVDKNNEHFKLDSRLREISGQLRRYHRRNGDS